VPRERFRDELIRPFLTITTIVITAVQLPSSRVVDPTLVWVMFVVVSALAITSLLPWTRLSARQQVALMAKVREKYGIERPPDNFRLERFSKLGALIDAVHAILTGTESAVAAATTGRGPGGASVNG